MYLQNKLYLKQSATYSLVASCTMLAMLLTLFVFAEPVIGHGQADATSNDFYIRTTVSSENSFKVVEDVDMIGTISGLTGGQATGTTDFVVTSNNASGYTVEISFYDNTTDHAMLGDVDGSSAIRNYGPAGVSEPSYGYTASTAAQFAYTVTSDNATHTDLSFISNGASCNVSGSQVADTCWKAPSTSGFQIVDTNSDAVGATSTLTFNVTVPNAPVPAPSAQTYTATATLSLFIK